MSEIFCPFCKIMQKSTWVSKKWKYRKIQVQRFECQCGNAFNYYASENSNWTIPKNPPRNKLLT